MAKLKGIKDKSETSDKIVTSKSGSWIGDLQAKQDAASAPVTNDKKVEAKKSTRKAPKYRQSHHTGHSCMRGCVCISKDGGKTAIRVLRKDADKLVKAGVAVYAKRSLWKATTRGTADEVVVPVEVKEKKVKKDKKKVDSPKN